MFEKLKDHSRIIVTGCQRSGTRIAAKMIAQDTGHEFIDEGEYSIHNEAKLLKVIQTRPNSVIHAPNWISMSILPYMLKKDYLIVYMKRSHWHIINSMERIGWIPRATPVLVRLGISNPHYWHVYALPSIIEARWEKEIKPQLTNYVELHYGDLKKHPLWVDAADRVDFKLDQTEIRVEVEDEQGTVDDQIPEGTQD